VTLRAPTRAEPLTAASVQGERTLEEAPLALDTASVFRRYAPYVAKIGLRILGRRDELDDFVQDVFLGVHKSLHTLREPLALKGWLAAHAVHEATRRLRRRRVRAVLGLGGSHDYADAADGAASPEQRVLLSRVFAALDHVAAEDRVAWALRYVEGETMERVAELTGCSLSTAKRRVAGAEEQLQKLGVGHG